MTWRDGWAGVAETDHGPVVESAISPRARRTVEALLQAPAVRQLPPARTEAGTIAEREVVYQPGEPGHVQAALESLPAAIVAA